MTPDEIIEIIERLVWLADNGERPSRGELEDAEAAIATVKSLREVTEAMVERASRARCAFFGWDPEGHVTYAGTKKVCRKPDGSPLLQWEFCKEETRAALIAALS